MKTRERAALEICDQEQFNSGHELTDRMTLDNRVWGFKQGCTYQEQVDREVIERLELTINKIDDHIRLMAVEGLINTKEMCRALKVISDELKEIK